MHTLHIRKITKSTILSNGSRFLDVEFDILNSDKKVVETRKLGFPLDMDIEMVKTELRKTLELYEFELKQKVKQKVIDEQDKNADKIIKKLEGTKL